MAQDRYVKQYLFKGAAIHMHNGERRSLHDKKDFHRAKAVAHREEPALIAERVLD